jgi:hypothetical protein
LILEPYYLEAAIHDKIIAFLNELAKGSHQKSVGKCNPSPRDALNCPKHFAELLIQPKHRKQVKHSQLIVAHTYILFAFDMEFTLFLVWDGALQQLFDKGHFFEFVDTKDKQYLLRFLWVIVSLHRLRRLVMQDISVAVVGAKKAGKGASLNSLLQVDTKSGFTQRFTTCTVESFR